MAGVDAAADRKLAVFISYSRDDEAFAQELLVGLELAGFEAYLDKHDIVGGEVWEARIRHLIEAADTVVFVISPESIVSERCAWEVEQTVSLGKRLLPVVWRRVDEAKVPERLRQLNYIFFDRPLGFAGSLQALATVLRTNFDWIREHTRLGELALRWVGRGRAEALLLRSDELTAARTWLASPPKYAPEPTLLHHEFIRAGEDAEVARTSREQRRLDELRAALEQAMAAQLEQEAALKRERAALDRIKQAQMAIGALLASIIGISILWRFQSDFYDAYYWRFRMNPTVLTAAQEQDKIAKPGSEFKECVHACPAMIVIPAGRFLMGSPEEEIGRFADEGPQREVTIAAAFAVSKFDLTFTEWDACASAGACRAVSDNEFGRNEQPVINVSWDDAVTYVEWLARKTGKNYRLLTEAEFEYAARAGSTSAFPWGDSIGDGNANCRDCSAVSPRRPIRVGSLKVNAFGLYDMNGNVRKWVQDVWHDTYEGAPTDGSAWSDGSTRQRVYRGGSWDSPQKYVRSAWRGRNQPNAADTLMGIRVARSLSP